MLDVNFAIESAAAVPFAAAPLLAFKLRVEASSADRAIFTVALRSQIQIEAARRHYDGAEQAALLDLFGEPDRWGQTLRTLLWTHASVVVPKFTGTTVVDLLVPCTFDFNVAATKYFHALAHGELPLAFLFSGTVFYETEEAALQVSPISWEKEARFRLPVAVWHELMDAYYPNSAWLAVRRDVFDRLDRYKRQRGLTTWEDALARLLAADEEVVSS